jgi:hypothetical protein
MTHIQSLCLGSGKILHLGDAFHDIFWRKGVISSINNSSEISMILLESTNENGVVCFKSRETIKKNPEDLEQWSRIVLISKRDSEDLSWHPLVVAVTEDSLLLKKKVNSQRGLLGFLRKNN